MKAQLWSYLGEVLIQVDNVEVDDDYDEDPYGDKVPFCVGSNQRIVTDPDCFIIEPFYKEQR
jgi:hypothetical protein